MAYKPMEIVAKVPIRERAGPSATEDLLRESHLIKLCSHPEYICEVVEEIVDYEEDSKEIENIVLIVERAKNDLSKFAKVWEDP